MLNVCDVTSFGMSLIRMSHNPSSVMEFNLGEACQYVFVNRLFALFDIRLRCGCQHPGGVIHNSYKYYTIHQFHYSAVKFTANQIYIVKSRAAIFQMKQMLDGSLLCFGKLLPEIIYYTRLLVNIDGSLTLLMAEHKHKQAAEFIRHVWRKVRKADVI